MSIAMREGMAKMEEMQIVRSVYLIDSCTTKQANKTTGRG